MALDSPQYDRDLRGADIEFKRSKDSRVKWHKGGCPMPGVPWPKDYFLGEAPQHDKMRPVGPYRKDPWKARTPSDRAVRSKLTINEALAANNRLLSDSMLSPELPSPTATNQADPFLYSFDSSESPGRPLSLDAYVKAPTARDTEKLVEKEYEVVDENGLTLRGKEAKRNLRRGAAEGEKAVDEGFELV